MATSQTTSNNSNKIYLTIIIILLLVIIGGGIFFFTRNNNSNSKSDDNHTINPTPTANTDDDENAETFEKDTPLGKLQCVKDQIPEADYCNIPTSKILNARKNFEYTLTELSQEESQSSDFEKLAKIEIDKDDGKEAKITFDKNVVDRYYDVKDFSYTITVPFSRKALSSKIAGFGQGVGDEYIFFLMEDGTIDMLRVYAIINDKNYNAHRIDGAKDVVTILGGSSYDEYSGGHTNFAVRKDQTAYDLASLLPSWGSSDTSSSTTSSSTTTNKQ